MAESFGNRFTVVEVTADDLEKTQIWVARAKASQALTLVLAAVRLDCGVLDIDLSTQATATV